MRAVAALSLFLALALTPGFGQRVGSASRVITLVPEEIVVDLVLATETDTLPEQAVAMLSNLLVTPQDLKSVGTLRNSQEHLGWNYTIIRPYIALRDTVRQLEYSRRQLREKGAELSYQFFLRPSQKTLDATKRRVLTELVNEAKRASGGNGKLRSVTIEPSPQNSESGPSALLFGQPSGLLQYNFHIIAVFDEE